MSEPRCTCYSTTSPQQVHDPSGNYMGLINVAELKRCQFCQERDRLLVDAVEMLAAFEPGNRSDVPLTELRAVLEEAKRLGVV